MPEQLLESELFGYVEGAFTGSRRSGKVGLFELAKGGTVFLDEIGSIPMSFQTRLLRVLQEKEVMRIGSNVLTPVDMRVIAASNRNLEHEVQAGRLREDLYFRLNVLAVNIPPLRERGNDVALIFESFLKEAVKRHSHPTFRVPAACIERLCCFSWPGNVRQLQSFVEHLVTLTPREFDPHARMHLM
jgi:Transcriptional regulator containing PAS, AAA-type ATPase, and DNA-binding domains